MMRWRGVHHVEFNVVEYDESIAFYDAMFGWLGYMSFWTLDIEYRSTYYMARFPLPHSYIGIQPAATGEKLDHTRELWRSYRALREIASAHPQWTRSVPREAMRTLPGKLSS